MHEEREALARAAALEELRHLDLKHLLSLRFERSLDPRTARWHQDRIAENDGVAGESKRLILLNRYQFEIRVQHCPSVSVECSGIVGDVFGVERDEGRIEMVPARVGQLQREDLNA